MAPVIAPLVGSMLLAQIITTAASFAISFGLSYYQRKRALAKAQKSSSPIQQNYRQSVSPTYYVVGLARVGGLLSEYEAVDTKAFVVAILSDDQIDGISAFYVRNTEVLVTETDGILSVTTPPFNTAGGSLVRLEVRFGGLEQEPSTILTTELPTLYQAKDNGAGVAYIVAEFTQPSQDKFYSTYGGAVPEIAALVRGVYAYDPRIATSSLPEETTWVWSKNPAIHVYRYIYAANGMALSANIVNQESIKTVADWCDQLITTKTKGVRPRYELGGIVRSDEAPRDVLTKMLDTFDGDFFIDSKGLLSLTCSDLDVPTVVITDDMIIDITLDPTVGALYETTSVKSRFSSEDHGYLENIEEADQWDNRAALAAVGRSIPIDHDLPMVFRHDQARVLMKKKWYEANPKWKAEIIIDFNGVELVGERLFTLIHAGLGLELTMKIESLELSERLENVTVRCISVDPTIRLFDYKTEEGVAPKVSAEIATDGAPVVPTGLHAAVSGTTAYLSWSPAQSGQTYEAQYKLPADPDWTTVSPLPSVNATSITGLTPAATYDFRVRTVAPEYGASNFATISFSVADTAGTVGSLQSITATGAVLKVLGSATQSTSDVSTRVQFTTTLGAASPVWTSPLVVLAGPSRIAAYEIGLVEPGTYTVHARSVAANGTTGPVLASSPVTVGQKVETFGAGSKTNDDGPGGAGGGSGNEHPVHGGPIGGGGVGGVPDSIY